jgi:hypothetical protein
LAFAVVAGTKHQKREEKMPNTIYIPDKTWTDLEQVPIFQKFMKEYIDLLQNKLKKVEVRGHSQNSYYYACGQIHDRRNPAWKPFKFLTQICKKYNYDPLIAREIIEDRIGRNLECECQIIDNNAENRRKELINNFGADLGAPGRRDFDVF